MSTPSFKYGNGVWATKEGSSLAYNDDNGHYKPLPFSVSRASSATRVNKQGLIEVVGNDRLRIDYSESTKGVALLEPSRSNAYPYSNFYGTGGLQDFNAGTSTSTVTNNYAISPDGTQNAIRFEATVGSTSSDRAGLRDLLSVSAVDSTISFYGKSNTGSNQVIGIHFTGGTQTTVTLTNEWQRFEYTGLSNTGNYCGMEIRGTYTDLSVDILLYGFQFEAGSYATSYIPTSGSTATRQADVANGAGVANVFNDSEGVLFADIAGFKAGYSRVMTISNESVNNRVTLFYPSLADTLYARVVSGGVSNPDIIVSIDESLFNKVAFKYKANDLSLWINGFEVGTETSATMPVGLSEFAFDNGATTSWEGKAKAINVYQTALTDAELEYLTSYRSLAEMVTELNLNAL